METINTNTGTPTPTPSSEKTPRDYNRPGRIMGGLFIVAIGLLLLARQAGADIPRWVFSFESILIALGLYLGIRHSFRNFVWLIPTFIGGFLLLDDLYPQFDFEDFIWPLLIIGVGLVIMFSASRKRRDWRKWESSQAYTEDSADDYLDSVVVFGGVKKNIISKNFRGGEAVTVFGGTEINFLQADLDGAIVVDLTQIFGGTKLIVPSHWKIQSKDMVAVFGGVDDKRPMLPNAAPPESGKTLILKGTCLFGGIDIRSY